MTKFNSIVFTSAAKNYIHALEYITQGNDLTNDEFIKMLCLNMRQSTITVLQRLYFDEFWFGWEFLCDSHLRLICVNANRRQNKTKNYSKRFVFNETRILLLCMKKPELLGTLTYFKRCENQHKYYLIRNICCCKKMVNFEIFGNYLEVTSWLAEKSIFWYANLKDVDLAVT